jgi:hypothetical protein
MTYIITYLLIGTIWTAWMEYYTTKHEIGPAWINKERVTQALVWPFALVIFLIELYKNL